MIFTALHRYYERQVALGNQEIPQFGYSRERISYAIEISSDGELVDVLDLRDHDSSAKKPTPAIMNVPKFNQKTSGIFPYFLWDKSSYVLGVSAKPSKKVGEAHKAFKKMHLEGLAEHSDVTEIGALIRFLENWTPEQFDQSDLFTEEMLDETFVFLYEETASFIHELPEAESIWKKILESANPRRTVCMVTGREANNPRLHPPIRGVDGAQSMGAALSSFNDDAYLSYGGSLHKLNPKNKENDTGASVQISLEATFGYTTALNYLLRRSPENRNRVRVGDSTVIFWAEAATKAEASAGETLVNAALSGSLVADDSQQRVFQSVLSQVAKGRPLEELGNDLDPTTRIYVLGLAPNAARLSVRFWETNTLDQFAKRLAQHYQDMLMEPLPWKTEPSIWRLINEIVPHRKGAKPKQDDASPQLAGELARAILTGQRYPQSLLTNLIMRFRADGDISSLRVALCKAVLVRNLRIKKSNEYDKELFMGLDRTNTSPGYLLGRLFCVLESAQKNAADSDLNSTIKDRFYGSASSTPMSVFQSLLRNSSNHLSKMKKQESKRGLAFYFESEMDEIIYKLDGTIAKSLPLEEQVKFTIGYHHQRYHKSQESKPTDTETTEGDA